MLEMRGGAGDLSEPFERRRLGTGLCAVCGRKSLGSLSGGAAGAAGPAGGGTAPALCVRCADLVASVTAV